VHPNSQPPRNTYRSDLTDAEWDILRELIPEPVWIANIQKPLHSSREMLNAIRYRTRTGCAWRLLPNDFPPWSTVQKRYYLWREAGVFEAMHTALRNAVRVMEGRKVEPSAAMLDSQSVKSTDVGGPKGFDAGKKR
jgi:putative transposase